MSRALALVSLCLLAPLSAQAHHTAPRVVQAPPSAEESQPKPIHGLLLGYHFGPHYSIANGLSEADVGRNRGFQGQTVALQLGYLFESGFMAALDFSFWEGANRIRTQYGELSLDVETGSTTVLVGYGIGQRVRAHLAALGGGANADLSRTLSTDFDSASHTSQVVQPVIGVQAGLEVRPFRWLAVGGVARAVYGITTDEDTVNLGGLSSGISVSLIL